MPSEKIDPVVKTIVKKYVEAIGGIDEHEIFKYASIMKPFYFHKNQVVVANKKTSHDVFFFPDGVVRYYLCDKDGIERNIHFELGSCFVDVRSCNTTESGKNRHIAMVNSGEGISYSWNRFKRLTGTTRLPTLSTNNNMEQHLFRKEQQHYLELNDSLEQRYLKVLEKYINIENKIPIYHIASYLGCTPQSLSKMRNTKYRTG